MAFTLSSNANPQNNTRERQPSEFDGYWLNIGPSTDVEIEGPDGTKTKERKFCRLPRGIAVSDLEPHKIYGTTNPDWAKEASLVNQVIEAIRRKAPSLEEGESVSLNLDVVLYRRQEATETVVAPADANKIDAALFG